MLGYLYAICLVLGGAVILLALTQEGSEVPRLFPSRGVCAARWKGSRVDG